MFRKLLDQGEAGDNVGVSSWYQARLSVVRHCKPGSIKPHTEFKCEAYVLTKDEGGRHTRFLELSSAVYFRTPM